MLYTVGRQRQVCWGSSVSLSLPGRLWGTTAGGLQRALCSGALQRGTAPQPRYRSSLCQHRVNQSPPEQGGCTLLQVPSSRADSSP